MGMRCEPDLEEMLADPAVRQLMARDGVSEAALRHLLDMARRRRLDVSDTSRRQPAAGRCCAP